MKHYRNLIIIGVVALIAFYFYLDYSNVKKPEKTRDFHQKLNKTKKKVRVNYTGGVKTKRKSKRNSIDPEALMREKLRSLEEVNFQLQKDCQNFLSKTKELSRSISVFYDKIPLNLEEQLELQNSLLKKFDEVGGQWNSFSKILSLKANQYELRIALAKENSKEVLKENKVEIAKDTCPLSSFRQSFSEVSLFLNSIDFFDDVNAQRLRTLQIYFFNNYLGLMIKNISRNTYNSEDLEYLLSSVRTLTYSGLALDERFYKHQQETIILLSENRERTQSRNTEKLSEIMEYDDFIQGHLESQRSLLVQEIKDIMSEYK